MRFHIQFLLAALITVTVGSVQAQVPEYLGKYKSTPEDIQAITKVSEDFKTALINKDTVLLSSLILNSSILFSSAPAPEHIKNIRKKMDSNFDGIFSGGVPSFYQFLSTEKMPIEEKFYNLKITQDDNMAWVVFDYEFQMDHKTQNYGIENWQLIKNADDQWKIISVVWSVHMAGK